MAFKLGSDDDNDLDEVHEINVTPFIDVMLVLLIIFMVAAPLSTVDVPVDLPTSNAPPAQRPDKPLFVTVRADKSLHVGDTPTTTAGLEAAILSQANGDRAMRIYLRADQSLSYGSVISVMNALRTAGFSKVALVTFDVPAQP